MKIHFIGHACFLVEAAHHRIIIDPYISENPVSKIQPEEIQVDTILITHGHGDHIGDALGIAARCRAYIIAPFELAMYCQRKGTEVHPMHIGGTHKFPFGRVRMTQALHGSGIPDGDSFIYGGSPCGYIIEFDGGTIYHAGDTGLFGDMKLLGELHTIDLALLPIGDNFVMGIDDAVRAAQLLKPKNVVPMHYNTREIMMQDANEFVRKAEEFTKVTVMNPGDTIYLTR